MMLSRQGKLDRDGSAGLARKDWFGRAFAAELAGSARLPPQAGQRRQSWLGRAGSAWLAQWGWLGMAGSAGLARQGWLARHGWLGWAGSAGLARQGIVQGIAPTVPNPLKLQVWEPRKTWF